MIRVGIVALHGKSNSVSVFTINAFYSDASRNICGGSGTSITLYSSEVNSVANAAADGKRLYTNSALTTEITANLFYSDSTPGENYQYLGSSVWGGVNNCK